MKNTLLKISFEIFKVQSNLQLYAAALLQLYAFASHLISVNLQWHTMEVAQW